jgi:hypothetical protein
MLLLFSVVALALVASSGFALVPELISFRGELFDITDIPVPDSNYTITFSVWDSESGGERVWSETQANVPVFGGVFMVFLGAVEPITEVVFDGRERYLEIQVGSDVITPRSRFASVPYSLRVQTVDKARGGRINGGLIIAPDDDATIKENSISIVDEDGAPQIVMSTEEPGSSSISMFEPADSKGNFGPISKRIELRSDALILFGDTDQDTNLIVRANGDITGNGQITMGRNSSPGYQTTVLGFENVANGDSSAIGGGSQNTTNGTSSTIAGGFNNTAGGIGSAIGGGGSNNVDGDYGTVPGGANNEANGDYSFAAGRRAMALHDGAFVWGDHSDADFSSTSTDQFLIRAGGGVGIGTSQPLGVLDVAGPAGDLSVNLPDNSIGPREMSGESGLSSTNSADDIILPQKSPVMSDLITTTITIPSAGYVIVSGGATMRASGTTQMNQAMMQIDDEAGGAFVVPYYIQAGLDAYPAKTEISNYFPMHTQRIFWREAGTHTFRVEARALNSNGGSAETRMQRPYISALFMPSSYGAVKTLVPSAEAAFEQATPVSSVDDNAGSRQLYEVDLRDLEIKAAQARLEAERLERELLRAKLSDQTNR